MLNPENNILPVKPNPKAEETASQSIRPQIPPQSNKNFSKIVDKEKGITSNSDEAIESTEEKEEAPSLFDLSAKKLPAAKPIRASHFNQDALASNGQENIQQEDMLPKDVAFQEGIPLTDSDVENPDEKIADGSMPPSSPMHLQRSGLRGQEQAQLNNVEQNVLPQFSPLPKDLTQLNQLPHPQGKGLNKGRANQPDILSLDTDATIVSSKEEHKSSSIQDSRFTQEKGDLSYINPPIQAVSSNSDASVSTHTSAPTPSRTVQELIDQIVKTIQTIEHQGKTDTVVTLQHPPLFKGSNIILTSYETAPNQFNLAFTNLGSQAKLLLDQRMSQDSLTLALENKGFTIHMITTTTLPETPITLASTDQQSFNRGGEKEQRGQQGSNKDFDEEA